jgi:ankyrin repeat protein
VVRLLLGAGGDVSAVDSSLGLTSLLLAALQGHAEAARLLLGAGSAVDAGDANGWTALYTSVVQGHVEMVLPLLRCWVREQTRDPRWR